MATIPSIAFIPSGYKASKAYSVLPTNGNADLDVVRNSTSNRINKDGLIEEMGLNVPLLDYSDSTCPSLLLQPQSKNEITYPLSFGNSYWTKSGASIEGDASTAGAEKVVNGQDWTGATGSTKPTNWVGAAALFTVVNEGVSNPSALKLEVNSTPQTYPELSQQITTVIGKTYKFTVDTKYVSGDNARVRVGSTNGGFELFSLDTTVATWVKHIHYFTATTTTTYLQIRTIAAISGQYSYFDNVSVKEVQGFTSPSVDYPTSAFKLVGDGANSTHYLIKYIGGTALADYAFSFYVKKGEISKIGIREDAQTGAYASFDLTTKTVLSEVSGTLTYEDVGNDFLRLKFVSPLGSNGTAGFAVYMLDDAYSGGAINGSRVIPNGSGFYIFAAQLEQQSFATSLMLPVTEGSTTTRLKDEVSKSGLSGEIGQTEGVLYAEFYSDDATGTYKLISLHDGGVGNYNVVFGYNTGESKIFAQIDMGGSQKLTSVGSVVLSSSTFNKVALRYKSGDCKLFLNGVEKVASTSTWSVSGDNFTDLSFNWFTGAFNFNGNTKQLQVYKTALTDAELIALTS